VFDEQPAPAQVEAGTVWTVFGDLMAGLLGLVVLLLLWLVAWQVDLATDLQKERQARTEETDRRARLERALAGPLAQGRIQFVDGRIGISGRVLFDLNSADLKPEGEALLRELAAPLAGYLKDSEELAMVSGFTDDLVIHDDNPRFKDNWELSAERALTVTRALVGAGIGPSQVFAAGFGEHQPIAPNTDDASRALNRRVEIVPVPRRRQ
jgi:flagellar motor protein MotB